MMHPNRFTIIASAFLLIAGWQLSAQEITRERNFEGTALYGFMNGGSDLYLEYGFLNLNVKEISFEGFEYSVETYTMDSPKDAFGIYSIHIFKPLSADSLLAANAIAGFDCLSKYQLQAACGNRYISIVFNAGSKAAAGAEKLLLSQLKGIAQQLPAVESFIPGSVAKLPRPFTGRLQYAKGELGLANADEEAIAKYPGTGTDYGLWIYNAPGEETVYFTDPL